MPRVYPVVIKNAIFDTKEAFLSLYNQDMQYVALLRGINVGGNSKIEMGRLKTMFLNLGFTDVSTYINSGNVIFETELPHLNLAKIIEKDIKKEFGIPVKCLVVKGDLVKDVASRVPPSWQNDSKTQKTDVLFLWSEYDKEESINLLNPTQFDNLKYFPGVIVWNLNTKNYNKSAMNKFIGTPIYKNMTARNINTVRKLAYLLSK